MLVYMNKKTNRRTFLQQSMILGGGLAAGALSLSNSFPVTAPAFKFDISLAQWSLHKAIFGGALDPLKFAEYTKKQFDISAVEYVNQFFADKATDKAYIQQLKQIADDNGVKSLLIMIDREGNLGDTDVKKRKQAVENHYKWVEAAKALGCHSIRVNAAGEGTAKEVQKSAIDGLHQLSMFAKDMDINVIVENHGSYSSNGKWLSKVIKKVKLPNCGTLPDFGNFCIKKDKNTCIDEYDKYQGVAELMPYAKGVSAKAYDFDKDGNETQIDFKRMLTLVKDAGYSGYIGVEYEGHNLSENDGIKATKKLLEKVREALA